MAGGGRGAAQLGACIKADAGAGSRCGRDARPATVTAAECDRWRVAGRTGWKAIDNFGFCYSNHLRSRCEVTA